MNNKKEKLIYFFGFNGILANCYMEMIKSEGDIVTKKLNLIKLVNQLNTVILSKERLEQLLNNNSSLVLRKVIFEEVLDMINEEHSIGGYKYSEVDEFDDNCVEDCKPGNHKCGK